MLPVIIYNRPLFAAASYHTFVALMTTLLCFVTERSMAYERKKLVVVGDGACGKTCLLVTFSEHRFPSVFIPTVFETYVSEITVDDKQVGLIRTYSAHHHTMNDKFVGGRAMLCISAAYAVGVPCRCVVSVRLYAPLLCGPPYIRRRVTHCTSFPSVRPSFL